MSGLIPSSKIYIAGHRGLVGSAILRRLEDDAYKNLLTIDRGELDLTRQADVNEFFNKHKPEYVFLAAAKVGGIAANAAQPAEFIRENLLIQTNIIDAAYRYGVKRLLFLGSSCIYPKHAPQPLKEEYLLTGALEPTNEAYAVAKIAGVKMCQAYLKQYGFDCVCLMPTNLYGPGDNFDPETSHVLPALLRNFHEAQIKGRDSVTVWGSGEPRREFLHVDDLVEACVFAMNLPSDDLNMISPDRLLNVGTGKDISIRELAELIRAVTGATVEIIYDNSRPDGTPRKLLEVSRMTQLGWRAQINLNAGLDSLYSWYLTQNP